MGQYTEAPTGPISPPTGIQLPPTGIREPLGYEVIDTSLSWGTVALIVLATVAVCLLILAIVLLCRKWLQGRKYKDLNRRSAEDRAYLDSELFNATSDIVRAAVRHNSAVRKGK
jgi:hypothetical protein